MQLYCIPMTRVGLRPVGMSLIMPKTQGRAKVAELVDALALGASGVTRESSSLSFRTSHHRSIAQARPLPVRAHDGLTLYTATKNNRASVGLTAAAKGSDPLRSQDVIGRLRSSQPRPGIF